MLEPNTATTTCQICGHSEGEFVSAREMMYGTREPFTYFECDGCGCLQLLDVPADLSVSYPRDYYSFNRTNTIPERRACRRWLNAYRNAGTIFGHDLFSRMLSRVRPGPDLSLIAKWIRPTQIRGLGSKVLDVGCGSGGLLMDMAYAGFRHLVGVDPFTASRTEAGGQVRILATDIARFEETGFDLVMCHHALEHMADQMGALRHMHRVLKVNGVCLIRIPIASSEVWRRYREHWVELDPPRHLVVHTRQSFEALARSVGFRLEGVEYDDSAFGYWVSELYLTDLSLTEPHSRRLRNPSAHFSPDQLEKFKRAAQAANARHDGGRAAFYLRKVPCSSALQEIRSHRVRQEFTPDARPPRLARLAESGGGKR
jgi:SAM-dependent methyltransferase